MLHEIDQHLEAHPIHEESKFEHLLKGVLPILKFVSPMLFFKPSWQKYLNAFIAAADVVVPAQPTLFDTTEEAPTDPTGPHGNPPGQ